MDGRHPEAIGKNPTKLYKKKQNKTNNLIKATKGGTSYLSDF